MIPFVFFGSCIGSILTAALLHWMYQGAFAKWEAKWEKTARAKITRLRLTDAERAAVEAAAADDVSDAQVYDAEYSEELRARAATLRGLLERLGGEQ